MANRLSSHRRIGSITIVILAALVISPRTRANAQGKSPAPAKIRLATPTGSLSYPPTPVPPPRGFFARGGFDMEVIQMAAGLAAPALLNRAIDYTTIPSGPATAGARGAPLQAVRFTSGKLPPRLEGR